MRWPVTRPCGSAVGFSSRRVWIGTPVALVTVNVQVCDVIAPALTVNEPLAICALVALTCGATKPAPIAAMTPVRMSGSRA